MKLILTHTEGDRVMTKGSLTVKGTDFECETSEPMFADYAESFQGCSYCCLPRGEHRCKVKATEYGPMTLVVAKCAGHVNTRFGFEPLDDTKHNTVLLESRRALERLNELVRVAYLRGEQINIEVLNECQTTKRKEITYEYDLSQGENGSQLQEGQASGV